METVAFFGLGQMGQGMARRLLDSGYRLHLYNRTLAKAEAMAGVKGASLFEDPADAVQTAEVLITMLSDDDAVASLVSEKVLQGLGRANIHLSMSTISPTAVRGLAKLHERYGVEYLACPVFGRPDAAAAGKLWLCLAGREETKSRVQQLLGVMGQSVYDFGSDPVAANVAKLAGNFLIASAIEAMAEAYSFAEKNRVDPGRVHDLLTQTLFACPLYQNYGRLILDRSFVPPGFTLTLGAKDVRYVRNTARDSQVPMPLASLLEDRFIRSLAKGCGEMDWTAIVLDQRDGAGLTSE